MSWKREGDAITLTMGVDEWEGLLVMMDVAVGAALRQRDKSTADRFIRLVNRVNEGNPHFTPYEIKGGPAEGIADGDYAVHQIERFEQKTGVRPRPPKEPVS